jgi:hypothetical protein
LSKITDILNPESGLSKTLTQESAMAHTNPTATPPVPNRAERRQAAREAVKQASAAPVSPGTSAARIAANRANSQHSTGPRSDPGKATSSQNALTHGLYSAALSGPAERLGEEREEFEALLAGIWAQHRPVGVYEEAMVDRIAELLWRLARVNARGQEYLTERLKQGAVRAFAIKEQEGFMVEEARIERALVRMTRNLEFLQRWRLGPAERPTARVREEQKEWKDWAERKTAEMRLDLQTGSPVAQAAPAAPAAVSQPAAAPDPASVPRGEVDRVGTAAQDGSAAPRALRLGGVRQPGAAPDEHPPEDDSPARTMA